MAFSTSGVQRQEIKEKIHAHLHDNGIFDSLKEIVSSVLGTNTPGAADEALVAAQHKTALEKLLFSQLFPSQSTGVDESAAQGAAPQQMLHIQFLGGRAFAPSDDNDADNYSSNTESCDDQDNNCNDVADENSSCYAATDLFFTEFQRSSNYGDPEGEWFEIYNDSGADITADGWQFFKGGQSFYVAPGVLTFPADDYTTFCYSDETLGTDCDYVYGGAIDNGASDAGDTDNSSWTMGNTPNFAMWLGSDALDDVPMNSSGWSNPTDGTTIQFVVPATFAESDNDDESNWCLVDTSGSTNRYYNGTGDDDDYGTPLGDADCAP